MGMLITPREVQPGPALTRRGGPTILPIVETPSIREGAMSQNDAVPTAGVAPAPVPLWELLPWAVFAGVLLLGVLYLVGLDQGAASVVPGQLLHEFLHDGRHLLAVPCH